MITLTTRAAGELRPSPAAAAGSAMALRVAVQPGGCGGLSYTLHFDDAFSDDDTVADIDGVRIVIDLASAPYLREATLDVVDGPGGPGFAMRNPVMSTVCSCADHAVDHDVAPTRRRSPPVRLEARAGMTRD